MCIRLNAPTKIYFKNVLDDIANRFLFFIATFFLSKKSSQSRKLSGQDGQPHLLAIKTPVLIPYPRTRPGPASRILGIIPPRLEQMKFCLNRKFRNEAGTNNRN
jgi:hypothetical protein